MVRVGSKTVDVKIVVEMFEQNVESACSVVVPASVKKYVDESDV